jgi:hypothetical protein
MISQAPVPHACNPSHSGGRGQENRGSKPARANSYRRPYLEKPFPKIGLVEWLKVKALSSSPSTSKIYIYINKYTHTHTHIYIYNICHRHLVYFLFLFAP